MQAPSQPQPKRREISETDRLQATAWQTILRLPEDAAENALGRYERQEMENVRDLDPTSASEIDIRIALARWQFARSILGDAKSFVDRINKKLASADQPEPAPSA